MELFASAPGLAVEESYVRLLNHLPGLAYRCRVGRTDPIVSERLEYTLEFVSKGSYDLLGIPAEDMVRNNNNTIERMMHPDDLQKTRRNMYDSIVAHQPYQVRYRVSLPSGRLKWIWDQGEGVFDADGELRYLEGLMMDISEQKFQELELKEENRQLKASVSNLYGLGNIVGKSEAMRRVYGLILKAAETDTNVIIYGETGSGKDLVAKAIHEYSARKGNYVPVNCGAIPEQLLESEFFGHTKGAFSGAHANKEGIGAAHNGTLFLDEIGELPIHLSKTAPGHGNKMYTPVGSNTPRSRSVWSYTKTFQKWFGKKDALGRLTAYMCHHCRPRERQDIPLLVASHGAQGHQLPCRSKCVWRWNITTARQRARAAQFSRPLRHRGCGP
ncbi:MAG: sigma 54-interacting transcriptional regulator [Bilophila wadsworthia]